MPKRRFPLVETGAGVEWSRVRQVDTTGTPICRVLESFKKNNETGIDEIIGN